MIATARNLELRDSEGRVFCTYDPAEGRAVLRFPAGNVEIRSAPGRITIRSEQAIRIESDDRVEIRGERGVRIEGEEATLECERITARAREAKTTFGRLEQTVGRWVQVAREAYLRVEGLFHTRAGRARAEAATTYEVRSQRARLLARDEMRIDGKTIDLG